MKQVVQQQRTGRLEITDVPAPVLQPKSLLVQTAYSLISAGTERAKVNVARKNLLGKALARPDQVRQVLQTYRQLGFQATYQKVVNKLDALSPLGYSSAGVVLAVGSDVTGFKIGDRVACGGTTAVHAEVVAVPHNLCQPVPANVPLEQAAFATLGAIALQGIRQTAPTLGETVGVIGLGLLGLLTVQLLRAAGCHVIGIDISAQRCEWAQKLGADAAYTPDDPALETAVRAFTPAGLDAVILTAATPSSTPIQQAGQLCRNQGRVVIVGDVGLDVPRSPFYEKELDIRLSRSYGPGRYDPQYEEKGVDYPIGYVRWTEGRNIAAFLDLLAQGKVNVQSLTTHRYPLAQATEAYDLIQQGQTPYLGVVLDYGLAVEAIQQPPSATVVPLATAQRPSTSAVTLALLGAGTFAQSMLLPSLKSHKAVQLRTVVTPSGLTARSVAERFGFAQCAGEPETALNDPTINTIIIASRHNSHAALTIRALNAGKAVFVEKPLALNTVELDMVATAYAQAAAPFLMVGFNRRFAPLTAQLRPFLQTIAEPLTLHFRVNAGFIPRDHWTQDRAIGGGRIVGELCHFVDYVLYLANAPLCEVFAYGLPDGGKYSGDNVTAVLRFANGSVATLTYTAGGDRAIPKERLEVFGGGRAATLEDFKQLTLASNGRLSQHKTSPDKGHAAEMQALVTAVTHGHPSPTPFAQLLQVSRATFAIEASLVNGRPMLVEN